ncbi:MAG: PPC domain-containing protein [Treponema sp.]|nr:PPC domain-containing protein [Treponema sp.]
MFGKRKAHVISCVAVLSLALVFAITTIGCPTSGSGGGGGGRGNTWKAPDGTEITISGSTFTIIVPSAGDGFVSARSNIRGNINQRTDEEMEITITRYSINGGRSWLSKEQFIDELIKDNVGESNWNSMTNEQKNILRESSVYTGSSNVRSLPVFLKLAYYELPDVNQLVITQTVTTTTTSNPTSTSNDTIVFQQAGTRTVPANLEGRWVYESAPNTILLDFTINQLVRRPAGGGSTLTFYVEEANGKLEIGTSPGIFTQTFCESYAISDGVLTFTGGQSESWYPGGEFTKYIFPPANVTILPLTFDQWASGNIPNYNVEQWFSFVATAATQYIHINFGTSSDLYVQVYDRDAETVGSETNFWGNTSRTSRTLIPGQTYYIRVRASSSGTYSILFNASTTAPEYTWTAPTNAVPLTAGTWLDSSIATVGGDAWYSFNVTAANTYRIWWNDSGQGNGVKTQNVSVTAFNPDGTTRFTNLDSAWSSSNAATNGFTPTADGTIYLQVTATATPGGTYGIVYTENDNNRPVAPFSPPNVTQLTDSQWRDDEITSASGSVMWYSFPVTNGTYRIWWNESGSNGDGTKTLDVSVAGFFSDGSEAFASQSTGWTTARTITVAAPDTVYLRVTPAYSGETGTFAIIYSSTLTARPIEIPAAATALTANTWVNGEITEASGNVLWYSFPVTNGTYYIWWNERGLTNGNGLKTLDINVAAYFGDGSQAFATQPSGWSTPRSVTVAETGTVYLRVTPASTGATGTFGIVFSTTSTRPTGSFSPLPVSTALTADTWVDGEITAASDGVAWYSFPVSYGSYYIWWNEGGYTNGNGLKTLDVNVIGYYSDGTEAFSSQSTGWSTPQAITATASDTVYLRVAPASSGATGTFGIVFSAINTRPSLPFNPPDVTTLTEGFWANGNIPVANGSQWFSFVATAATQYIHVGYLTLTDLYIQVYQIDGTAVGEETNLYNTATSINRTVMPGQMYYIRVRPWSPNNSGTYNIKFSTSATP